MEPYRWLRRDLKRFAVEFLCLSMLLQGYPAQALEEHATKAPSQAESVADRPTGGPVEPKLWERASEAVDATATATLAGLDQPWGSALALLLGLSSLAIPQDGTAAPLEVSTGGAAESPQGQTSETRDPGAVPAAVDPIPPPAIRLATKVRRGDATAIQRVEGRARRVDAGSVSPARPAPARPSPAPRRSSKTVPAEISALANELGSPAAILRHVHDTIRFDPKHGADSPPLGTLWELRGTAWDQAWLLQELLRARGVDARLEWGEVEITPDLLTTLAGVDDPVRAADLLTTAGTPVVLVVGGSEVIAARMPHVWVKAHLDYIPNRGLTHGTPDTWIRMDPTLKDHSIAEGQRLDQAVPYVLADHLASGTEQSPRQDYEADLVAEAGTSNLDSFKPLRTLRAENFPFVPGTLRAKVLSVDGESETVPTAKQVRLEVAAREPGGDTLFSWSTPLPAIYGETLGLRWRGATSADQANLDLYGGIYTTPPYEVELAGELRLGGSTVADGGSIGAAEDIELTATITPPDAVATTARWDLFAGEHAVLGFDLGHTPPEVFDRFEQRADAASSADDREANQLAAAASTYFQHLGDDLDHLGALRWHRVVPLATAVLAVQRGAVSTFPNGSPETFSRGPLSLDLGAMPLGIFPADGAAVELRPTIELLGSQASVREGDALVAVFGGEHPTAVGFLKQAVREGQTLTRVDAGNLEAALADAELGDDAESAVRDAVERGQVAWVAERQIEINGWQTSGYVVQEPGTGLGGGGSEQYSVAFERRLSALGGAVTFHAPQDLDVVTAPTDVVATIDAEGLRNWTLATRPAGSSASQVIATGTGPVENATLGEFDPTLLLNGLHELILTGTDAAGQSVTGKVAVSVEGNMKIGHFTLSFVDLAIPVSGLDIEVVRTYDSRQRIEQGDFGQGWTLDIRQGSYRNNRPPGDGWQIPGTEGPWGLPCSTVNETKSHLTTVRLSDQEVYRFRLALQNPATVIGGCFADAVFEWVDGPLPGTTLEVLGATQVFVATGSDRAVLPDTQEPFVPEDVKLTTRDGRIFHLDLADGVTRVEDLNGNLLEITPEGITHSSGKGIEFERDDAGRIVTITDPMGNSNRYAYDEAGDLVSFTDRVDAVTRFTYTGEHYLEDIENALGVRAVRTEYDEDGRVARMIDADGKVVALDHDLVGRREVITNRLGFVRVLEYDERGNVVRGVDELGNATTRTYDGRDNLLSETNPLGEQQQFAYTADNEVRTIRDPLGHTSTLDYGPLQLPLTFTDALGNVTANTYSPSGLLISTVDPLGQRTSFQYDASGNLLAVVDALGQTTSFSYDAAGNLVSQTDALGHHTDFEVDANGNRITEIRTRTLPDGATETLTTRFERDALGRVTAITAPDGAVQGFDYDALGRVVRQVDPLGNATLYQYDGRGLPESTTHADGTSTLNEYDAEGRRIAAVNALGHSTSFVYDAAGRLVQTIHPGADEPTETQSFDAAGRLVAATDALGATAAFRYDAAGRRTQVVDALGHTTSFEYDAANRVRRVTDALGHTTEYGVDAAGLVRSVVAPDGSTSETVYDALGRQVAKVDAAGKRTEFVYDPAGRLTQVKDALGGTTTYGYDEVGNPVETVDAKGHGIRFEHDGLGRQIARILPDGARETFAYDLAGRLVEYVDPNGAARSFTYDALGRLTQRSFADGTSHRFTYTATGRRASVTDGRGGVTTYDYDDRDRQIRKTTPEGHLLDYGYDAVGNPTELAVTVGTETSSDQTLSTQTTYDALGRVATVVDPRGGVYRFDFDALGQSTRVVYPNGVVTERTYDANRRLTDLVTRNAAGDVLQGFHYTLAATGHRLRVDEDRIDPAGDLSRAYSYDDLWRLTEERVADAADSLVYQQAFTYDAVGNRLASTWVEGSAPAETTAYTFDERDRLQTVDGQPLAWDAAGRLLSQPGDSGSATTTLSWDFDDRLTEVQTDGGTLQTTYDVEGRRVTSNWQPAAGEPETTLHLVDDTAWLSHEVAEIVDGEIASLTVRAGGQLLGRIDAPGTDPYLHLDGLGSVRGLSDASGALTGTVDTTAFGERLPGSDASQPYGFTGEPWIAAGFAYHRARWLDPRHGRFLSPDPFPGWPTAPASQHRYGYAHQDPVNLMDPSGLFISAGRILAVSAAVGILTTITAPPLANYLGYQMTTLEAVEAGAWAALFTAVALVSPLAALGVALYGWQKSLELYFEIWSRPNASPGQKAVATGLLVLAAFGVGYAGSHAAAAGTSAGLNRSPSLAAVEARMASTRAKGVSNSGGKVGPQPTQLAVNPHIIDDYARRLLAGERLPPIEIVELPDGRQFILDGHHRFIASQRTGIPVEQNVTRGGGPIGFRWESVEFEYFAPPTD